MLPCFWRTTHTWTAERLERAAAKKKREEEHKKKRELIKKRRQDELERLIAEEGIFVPQDIEKQKTLDKGLAQLNKVAEVILRATLYS